MLFASFSVAQFLCAPLLGRASDRIGRKPVIIMSLFGTAVGSFVTAAAGALGVDAVPRAHHRRGVSGASVSVAQGAVTDVAPPDQRARLLGLLGAAFGVGFVLGPALGGLAALGGPHVPFYVAGAIALVNGVIAIFRVPETRPESARAHRVERSARAARVWDLAIAGFIAVCAFSGFEATFALLADERFGLTEAGVAAIFVVVGIVLVTVQGGATHTINARLGTAASLRSGLLLNAAGLVLLAAATTWWVLCPALLLLTVGQAMVMPNLTLAVTGRVPDHQRGEALGFQQGVSSMARVVGPAVAGALFQHVGIPAPYLVGAALCGVALAVLAGTRQPEPVTA